MPRSLLIVLVVVCGCGRYDVTLLAALPDAAQGPGDHQNDDGGARGDADSTDSGPADEGAADDGSDDGGSVVKGSGGNDGGSGRDGGSSADSGLACVPPSDRVCLPDGAACVVDPECCSSVCAAGFCMPDAVCAPPGTQCATRDVCCSGRCEPTTIRGGDAGQGDGTTRLACLNICLADGVACRRALDCCSMSCHAGVCGGSPCLPPDGSSSDDGTCQSDDSESLCLESGDFCNASGSRVCCSGVCSASAG
ncbi:MAG TPA: hypothetical protein VN894_16570, partial [Polyangiaceae bacterium]|nr:hypothetical protein [Polyangiaceae bacterium]